MTQSQIMRTNEVLLRLKAKMPKPVIQQAEYDRVFKALIGISMVVADKHGCLFAAVKSSKKALKGKLPFYEGNTFALVSVDNGDMEIAVSGGLFTKRGVQYIRTSLLKSKE